MNFIEKSKAVLRTIAIRHTYRRTFSSRDGEEVLRDICRLGGLTKTNFSENPQKIALNEGRRQMALAILSRAVQDPQAFISKQIQEETP